MSQETASAVPRSAVSCTITARHLNIIQDKPESSGGTDEGFMASELLMASLLSCQLSTFHKVAAKRRSDVKVESIRAELQLDDEADEFSSIELIWKFTGGDESQHETLMRLTDKVCTVSKGLSFPVTYRSE